MEEQKEWAAVHCYRTELFNEFSKEWPKFIRGEAVDIRLRPLDAYALLSAVQLASRHPHAADSPTIKIAVRAARKLQKRIPMTPAITAVAEKGWDPDEDCRTEYPTESRRQ